MTAARTGIVAAVRALVERGADVNAVEVQRGQTALMWAAADGHAGVVRELVARGADVATPIEGGIHRTAVRGAARAARDAVDALTRGRGANRGCARRTKG